MNFYLFYHFSNYFCFWEKERILNGTILSDRVQKFSPFTRTISFFSVDALFDVSCKVGDQLNVVIRRTDDEITLDVFSVGAAPQVFGVDGVKRIQRLKLDADASRQVAGHPNVVDPENVVRFRRRVD